jgi:hypothetical protein
MAGDRIITIPFDLPRDEWCALAQFLKRADYETCVRCASRFDYYNGRAECDVMWSSVCGLQRQLAEAGFSHR